MAVTTLNRGTQLDLPGLHTQSDKTSYRESSDVWKPGPRLNIKIICLRYGDSHVKDKTVARFLY